MRRDATPGETGVTRNHGVIGFFALATAFASALIPAPASAALPELRIAPLRYDEHLELGHLKGGVIDASNPTGSTIHVTFQVQAFRQIGDRGELEFYDDERLASAVTPATPEFDLGPREAIRTQFTIDPNRLGPGGAYGVIFLRTSTPGEGLGQIKTSARVGTLLILSVGSGGTQTGQISPLSVPFAHYGGHTLDVHFHYTNTGQNQQALAFASQLAASLGRSASKQFDGPFVFPGRTRSGQVALPLGNRLGLYPVTVSDSSGSSRPSTRWVLLVTGFWVWAAPILALVLLGLITLRPWRKMFLLFVKNFRNRLSKP